jgi:signal transduction histidine kinase
LPEAGEPAGPDERLQTLVHDLRTPLAVVSGFVEMLLGQGEHLAPERRQEYLERVAAAVSEIRELLDDEPRDLQGVPGPQ